MSAECHAKQGLGGAACSACPEGRLSASLLGALADRQPLSEGHVYVVMQIRAELSTSGKASLLLFLQFKARCQKSEHCFLLMLGVGIILQEVILFIRDVKSDLLKRECYTP